MKSQLIMSSNKIRLALSMKSKLIMSSNKIRLARDLDKRPQDLKAPMLFVDRRGICRKPNPVDTFQNLVVRRLPSTERLLESLGVVMIWMVEVT
jgi:hypothetical protein